MTKREYEMYHKEVYDKYGNRLYPGDTVVAAQSYYHECDLGVVHHFGEKTVIIQISCHKWGDYQVQRIPNRVIKIKDRNGDDLFMQNWPKRKSETA